MSDEHDWQKNLAGIRMRLGDGKARCGKAKTDAVTGIGAEAVMTLVSIMKDDSDPRLQIAAAKALLDRTDVETPGPAPGTPHDSMNEPSAASPDDIDAAIALAKAVLDELASRKAGSLAGTGELGSEKPSLPDHPGR